ncbi:hypothetical protein [Streptomyces sp. NPDC090053]|uniref:hypothetical protein n=1 Tax=Streptomyces sp. NPDC090053 TaxID=3365932 RepID=UPI003809427E
MSRAKTSWATAAAGRDRGYRPCDDGAAGVWPGRVVLLVCAGAIALTTVLNLCVRDVYRIKRQPVREESRTGRVPVP